MNRIKTNLFIGGGMDGIYKELPPYMQDFSTVRFPVLTHLRGILEEAVSLEESLSYEEYRRERLRAEDTLFDVWIVKSLTPTEALMRLLAGYRPEKAEAP